MRRFRLKALLALVLALCLSLTSLPGGFAFADELDSVSTEAPVLESLDDEPDSDFDDIVNAPVIEENETEYADDDLVRVFIVFEDESVVESGYSTDNIAEDSSAMKYSDELTATQEEVIEKIEEEALEGESLDTKYSFTLLTNAVSADVKYKELEEIEAVDGVSAVYIAPVYETMDNADPQTMTAGEMVGSYKTWESGYTGAGMRIAIVDTGLDVNHPSFSEDGFLYGLNETAANAGRTIDSYNLLGVDEIAGRVDKLNATARYNGLTADDLYVNAKVPFGFNYVDDNLDLKHLIEADGTHDDHGSHVAGIATANKYINYDGEYKTEKLGVVGIAPDAQLFVMRVFGVNGGAYSDDYMAAIEDAILLGADSINLSLGSASAGESVAAEAYINEIFDRLINSDTVVVISAGNSGSWGDYSTLGANLTTDVDVDTVGSPGSYRNAFTVASAVNSSFTGFAVKFGDMLTSYINGSNAPNAPMTSLDTNGNGTEYDYVFIPGYGEEEDFANVDVNGKIVLVSRGNISFYVKHMNAANAGAAGLFVYNNTTGTISMNLTGSDAKIPAASITLEAAQKIVDNSVYDETNGTYSGKVTVLSEKVIDYNVSDAFLMSNFSSWGVPGDLALKPEITAPGGNIYSTTDEGTYDVMSGTSMAAPSVAGLSALVIQYIEENDLVNKTGLCKRTLAQSLLMSTATPLTQADGLLYSPRKQGAGLANAAAATTSQAYILVGAKEGNDGKVKIELGDDPARAGKYSFDFDVYNFGKEKAYFKLDSTFLTEAVLDQYFIANASYKLNPKVDIKAGSEALLYDVDGNGKVSYNDVYALLYHVNLKKRYEIVDTFPEAFDFNGNGIVDTDDVSSLLKAVKRPSKSKINLKEKVFAVKNNAKVSVTVTLSKEDKQYLDSNFENGMYVDGFVTLDGKVDMSVPVLAFYGNWSDASMFDPFNAMEYLADGEERFIYNGIDLTNFLTYQFAGDPKSYYYQSNMYAEDGVYIEDRNAISSLRGDKIGSFYFTLIRNAENVTASITNAETGEEYLKEEFGSADATYYSTTRAAWQATRLGAKLNWAVTDAEGNPLPDGTKVNISISGVPSYYVENPDKPLGKGTTMTIPMTVDNTAPKAELKEFTETVKDVSGNVTEAGKLTIDVSDNRYVAAVYILGPDKKTVLQEFPVGQTELGATTELSFEYPETVIYVTVIDYAGNKARYRVNASGQADTTIAESIELSDTNLTLIKGSSAKLEASVGPMTLIDDTVTWMSLDESIATVDESGVVTAVGEGRTIVGAVTNSLGADGEPLVAACAVEVIELNVDLNTTLWDEEGKVFFGKFNSSDLTLNKLSAAQAARFQAAAVVDGTLYAVSMDDENGHGSLYAVNPDTFESELINNGLNLNTDIAYGAGNDALYGIQAYFLILQERDGSFITAYNLSSKMEGTYFTGIAALGSTYVSAYGCDADIFYLIDDEGNVYQFIMVGKLGYIFEKIGETGISSNGEWQFSSLYYDDESGFMFYSCYDGSDEVTLYAVADYYNSQTGEEWVEAYRLGQFATKVWPVSGLYQWDSENKADTERVEKIVSETALSNDKLDSIVPFTFSFKKQTVLSDGNKVEEVTEDVSDNEAAVSDEEAVSEDVEAPAEDVSDNEAAPQEAEAPAEEAEVPVEEAEEPAPDTSANEN